MIERLTMKVLSKLNLDLKNGPWLAGGAAKAMYLGEKLEHVSDLDIFCSSYEQINKVISTLLTEFNTNEIFSSENAKTFSTGEFSTGEFSTGEKRSFSLNLTQRLADPYYLSESTCRVQPQVILQPFSSVYSLLDNFDFGCIKIATDASGNFYSPNFSEVSNGRINVDKLRKNSVARLVKYITYGYHLTDEELYEIYSNVDNMDWKLNDDINYDFVV